MISHIFGIRGQFFSEIEVFEAFSCCCFGPVVACAVIIVDDAG